VSEFDPEEAKKLIDAMPPDDVEWDSENDAEDNPGTDSSYVDGVNDTLSTHARPLAGALDAAIAEIAELRSEVATLSARRDDHLALIARLSRETPLPSWTAA